MSIDDFNKITDAFNHIVSAFGVIVGGFWAYRKFVRQEEDSPKIEFKVDVRFVGRHQDEWIVELVAQFENKGLVRHSVRNIGFDLRTLRATDELTEGSEKINQQLCIPNKVKESNWVPAKWGSTFVQAGVRQEYVHVARVPGDAEFVLIHGRFEYEDEDFHTADRLVRVPHEDGMPPALAAIDRHVRQAT